MVLKLVDDLIKSGQNLENVYFEFDEWSSDLRPIDFNYNFLLNFSNDTDPMKLMGKNFQGFIFNFNFFQELYQSNLLHNFAINFYTRYHTLIDDHRLMLLKIDWQNDLLASLFEYFEFNLISFPINSQIEICYRNVDLKKLSSEMEIFKKNNFVFQDLK
jgi:hypothetical protein